MTAPLKRKKFEPPRRKDAENTTEIIAPHCLDRYKPEADWVIPGDSRDHR
jgi:hypothetical protein